ASLSVLSGSGCGASALLPAGSVVVMACSTSSRFGGITVRIGIGDTKPRQYSRFKTLHHRRVGLGLMVVADQMQKTLYNQVDNMVIERQPLIGRFAANRLFREHNVTENQSAAIRGARLCGRKGEDVGRFVLAAKHPVEHTDMRVVGEDERDLVLRLEVGPGQ